MCCPAAHAIAPTAQVSIPETALRRSIGRQTSLLLVKQHRDQILSGCCSQNGERRGAEGCFSRGARECRESCFSLTSVHINSFIKLRVNSSTGSCRPGARSKPVLCVPVLCFRPTPVDALSVACPAGTYAVPCCAVQPPSPPVSSKLQSNHSPLGSSPATMGACLFQYAVDAS